MPRHLQRPTCEPGGRQWLSHRHRTRHPGTAGRESELGSLSDALRRLVALAVTTTVPAEVVSEVASDLDALADRLEVGLPAVPFPRFVGRDPSKPRKCR